MRNICFVLILFFVANCQDCETIRTKAACTATGPNSANAHGCWWDSSAEGIGHACKAFSGDCHSINTTVEADCNGAGRGGKCTYLAQNLCGNTCSQLVGGTGAGADCTAEDYCYWDAGTCKKCQDGVPGVGVCPYGCRASTTTCVLDCQLVYQNDEVKCDATSGCYWSGTGCVYGTRPTISEPPCSQYNNNKQGCDGNDTCYYDSVIATCKPFSNNCPYVKSNVESDCTNAGGTNSCTWVSGSGCVLPVSNCASLGSGCARSDCWYNGTTCMNFNGNCGSLPATTPAEGANCESAGGGGQCFYNSSSNSCVNISSIECIRLTHAVCIDYGTNYGKCKWNSSSCVSACDIILNEDDCYDRQDCYWDSGSCYAQTTFASTACAGIPYRAQCDGRADCYYSNWWGCLTFSDCQTTSFANIQDDCTSAKRCVYDSLDNICVDEIYAPITGTLNCSAHYERRTCDTDVQSDGKKRCYWNSNYDGNNNGLCVDYPVVDNCRAIKSPNEGGAFSNPSDFCGAYGCVWVPTDISSGVCNPTVGVCVDNLGTTSGVIPDCYHLEREYCERATNYCFWHDNECTVRCSNEFYPDSVKCYGSAVGTGSANVPSGCFWTYGSGVSGTGSCVTKSCNLANSYHITADIPKYCAAMGSLCEYQEDRFQCLSNCSLFTASACPQTHCYLNGNVCTYLPSSFDCSKFTVERLCSLKAPTCYWVSNDVSDYSKGNCYDLKVVKNTIIRGCDDIINQEQCENHEYYAINHQYPTNCSFIEGKCVPHVPTASVCDSLNNEAQCISKDECYWTDTYTGVCLSFTSCADINEIGMSYGMSYSWNSLVCNNRHNCIWDSYTKTCENLGIGTNNVADFHNAIKDCKNKGGHLVNSTCYSNYDVAGVTSCGNYDEKTCNGDNEFEGATGCGQKKGCYWEGSACVPFGRCADIVDESTCNNKQGCYFGQGVCNKVVCSLHYGDMASCNAKKECYYYYSDCNSVENFPKKACEAYYGNSEYQYLALDGTKGTGEGCNNYGGQSCEGYLWEELCNDDSNCIWDDYRKVCVEGYYNSPLSNEYARQRMCTAKGYYWDGGSCYSSGTRYSDKCVDLNDPLSCNYDEQSCRLGCVWNSNDVNASCHLFVGCSSIVAPFHTFAERDCKAKQGCSWDSGVCKNAKFCQYGLAQSCNANSECEWSYNEYTCKIKDTCADVPCDTSPNCWCDKHFRPPRSKLISRCVDVQSESECGRIGPARGCYWQAAGTALGSITFPVGVCLDIPTTTGCAVITEPRLCQSGTQPCVWNYSSNTCVGFTGCSTVTAKANCNGKSGCVWKGDRCYTVDDCTQFTAENACNEHYDGATCVFAWSSDKNTGTCVKAVGCGVFVNRDQCLRSCFWRSNNNANKGNCFESKADAGIYGVNGVINCSELCDESDCQDSNNNPSLYPSSDTCYWNGSSSSCLPFSVSGNCWNITDIGACDKKTSCFWNSSFDNRRGRCEEGSGCSSITVSNNPLAGQDCTRKSFCLWNSATALCTASYACGSANKSIDCAALSHCYWQSDPNPDFYGACTYFWGCGEIASQTDCQDKGCGWNKKNKACGDGPKSKAKWSNGAVAAVVVLAVLLGLAVVAIVAGVVLFILWRKKKIGVSNVDDAASNSSNSNSAAADGTDDSMVGSSAPLSKGNDGASSTEQAVMDIGEN